jgi:ADP-ribosylglycohydrolase
MRDVVSYVDLHRPSQRGGCGSSGFLPHPPEPEEGLAVVTDRRGEADDPTAARGLPHTLRAGRSCDLRRHRASTSGTAYVVDCLEAALWAFHRSDSFKDGALLAVNLGDDADTTGAVFGQLAGAYYGEQGIPEAWRSRLAYRELIERYAEQLCALGRPA